MLQIGLRQRYGSDFPSLNSSGCVPAVACACWPAAASSSSFPASGCASSAVFAVDAHARFTPMHDTHNSCSDTALNLLRVQRATRYNPEGVVAHDSRRKVMLNRTVGSRSVVQTVDMSPAPAAGTYRRSAGTVHDPATGSSETSGRSSGVGAGPGPGPGGRSGFVGGVRASLRPAWRFLAHWWCHLGDINLHRNLWVGRGYVVPRIREFGC